MAWGALEGIQVGKRLRHSHARGRIDEKRGAQSCHAECVGRSWAKILAGEMWHDRAVPKSRFCKLDCFSFFVEFLGCALVGDCVWAILEAI